MNINYVFLGGMYLPEQMEQIQRDTVWGMQNAADALQKALLKGLSQRGRTELAAVNLPFVGSYPRLYRRPSFPALRTTIFTGVDVYGIGFCNVRVVRLVARLWGAFSGLRTAKGAGRAVAFVYSANLPFIMAAFVFKWLHDDVTQCLIVPDLPEFMDEGGWQYRLAKSVESAVLRVPARLRRPELPDGAGALVRSLGRAVSRGRWSTSGTSQYGPAVLRA